MKVTRRIYRIPVQERFAQIGEGSVALGGPWKLMEVDGIGLVVFYEKPEEVTPENVRRHLIGLRASHALVEADGPAAAIRAFHAEYAGARIGTRSAAVWIDRTRPIVEYPLCRLMHRSRERKELLCGEETDGGNGEFGMCVLEGYDPPDGYCPARDADRLFEKRDTRNWEEIDGYLFFRAERFLMEQEAAKETR